VVFSYVLVIRIKAGASEWICAALSRGWPPELTAPRAAALAEFSKAQIQSRGIATQRLL